MERSWIHHVRGRTTRQARVGTVGMHEELFGRQGFVGPAAMLYHRDFPNAVLRIEGSLKPRVGNAATLAPEDGKDARGEMLTVLKNDGIAVDISRRSTAMPFCYRNADGDLLYFVHRGTGVLATEFGPIDYEPGDYIYLPKGTTFRHLPADGDGLFFVIESTAPIALSEHLQVGRHVPFDPSVLTIPDLADYGWPKQDEWELVVKHGGDFTSIFYANCPIDLIGWKGDLFPFKINIRDIIPLTSDRIHLAPSSWATFEGPGFMIVTFVPQVAVADLTAEELPSNHRNIDCDEVVFVHSSDAHPAASLMHMPQGYMHGSSQEQRERFEAIRTSDMRRSLCGVSIDTFQRLQPTDAFRALTGG